jgi:hypothetical protein
MVLPPGRAGAGAGVAAVDASGRIVIVPPAGLGRRNPFRHVGQPSGWPAIDAATRSVEAQ